MLEVTIVKEGCIHWPLDKNLHKNKVKQNEFPSKAKINLRTYTSCYLIQELRRISWYLAYGKAQCILPSSFFLQVGMEIFIQKTFIYVEKLKTISPWFSDMSESANYNKHFQILA